MHNFAGAKKKLLQGSVDLEIHIVKPNFAWILLLTEGGS